MDVCTDCCHSEEVKWNQYWYTDCCIVCCRHSEYSCTDYWYMHSMVWLTIWQTHLCQKDIRQIHCFFVKIAQSLWILQWKLMATCQDWQQIQFGGQLMDENCQKFGFHLGLNESWRGWLREKVWSWRQGLSWCLHQNRRHVWLRCAGDDQESKLASLLSSLGIVCRWMWSKRGYSWYQGEVDGGILSLDWEVFCSGHVLGWLKYR